MIAVHVVINIHSANFQAFQYFLNPNLTSGDKNSSIPLAGEGVSPDFSVIFTIQCIIIDKNKPKLECVNPTDKNGEFQEYTAKVLKSWPKFGINVNHRPSSFRLLRLQDLSSPPDGLLLGFGCRWSPCSEYPWMTTSAKTFLGGIYSSLTRPNRVREAGLQAPAV
jgi:hypothetical protein